YAETVHDDQIGSSLDGSAQHDTRLEQCAGIEAAGLRLFAQALADGIDGAVFQILNRARGAVVRIALRARHQSAHHTAARLQAPHELEQGAVGAAFALV